MAENKNPTPDGKGLVPSDGQKSRKSPADKLWAKSRPKKFQSKKVSKAA